MTVSELDMKNKSSGFLQSAFNSNQFSAKDYVSDGLLVMYDGIENAGFGMHDPSAATWKDLANSYDLIVPSSLTWHEQFLELDGEHCAYNLTLPHSVIGTVWTCECVYSIEETGTNYKGLFGCKLSNYRQIYGLNYWTSVSGGWSMGIHGQSGSVDIVISESSTLQSLVQLSKKNYLVLGQRSDKKMIAGMAGVISVEKSSSTVVDLTHSGIMLGRGYASPTSVDASRCLRSKIYAFRLYNKALSDTEIACNYAIDAKRFDLTTGEDA